MHTDEYQAVYEQLLTEMHTADFRAGEDTEEAAHLAAVQESMDRRN